MGHRGLRAVAAALACVASVASAAAADWSTEGPVGSGDGAYCLAVSPEGLAVRRTHDQNSYGLAFFDVKNSSLLLSGSPESGQHDIRALMLVDPSYTALRTGFAVLSSSSEDADVFITSSDFHLYDALKAGSTLTVKIGSDVPPTLSIEKAPGTAIVYSLSGSSKAIAWVESCITPTAASATGGPSFDCKLAASTTEKLICADPVLAAFDQRLSGYYARAKVRAEDAAFTGDDPIEVAEWFAQNTKSEWDWREKNCTNKPCLLRWYERRQALLQWLAESEFGFADSGVKVTQQLQNGDTLIAFSMSTYTGNSLWSATTQTYGYLPDGAIEIVNEAPLVYKTFGQKGYFNGGGAFWFDTLRAADGTILDFLRPDEATCLPRDEFFAKTNFVPEVRANITAAEICFYW